MGVCASVGVFVCVRVRVLVWVMVSGWAEKEERYLYMDEWWGQAHTALVKGGFNRKMMKDDSGDCAHVRD